MGAAVDVIDLCFVYNFIKYVILILVLALLILVEYLEKALVVALESVALKSGSL